MGAVRLNLMAFPQRAMQAFGTRGEHVVLKASGTNALGFDVAFHLGRLATKDPGDFFHAISKDTGFDLLIQHLKARKVSSARSPSIEEMPCFRAVGTAAPVAIAAQAPLNEHRLTNTSKLDELFAMALAQLVAMKQARPAKLSTLHSTIQAKPGKDIPGSTVDKVCSELVKRGVVKVAGERVAYAIPGECVQS